MIYIKILRLLYNFSYILIPIGIIAGILYMIMSKQKTGNKVTIGLLLIFVPIIIRFIIRVVYIKTYFNL